MVMTKATLHKPSATAQRDSTHTTPLPVEVVSDILDWDVTIETPPPRRTGMLRVTLEYVGRSKPIAVTEPLADD
jgi:hypothetical protein